jgi:hypothetical protein
VTWRSQARSDLKKGTLTKPRSQWKPRTPKKAHISKKVCYVCGREARPGSGMTDTTGRRHKVCPPAPSDPQLEVLARRKRKPAGSGYTAENALPICGKCILDPAHIYEHTMFESGQFRGRGKKA